MPKTTGGTDSRVNTRTIAIFGGYSVGEGDAAYRFAHDLGRGLAEGGFEVVNGGYAGTMRAASQGAREAGGATIGVTCPKFIRDACGPLEPNAFLDEIVPATDILSRIETMMRLSGGYVVLDGGTGTLSELGIVWEFVSKGFLPPRPVVVAGKCWGDLIAVMKEHRQSSVKHLHVVDTPEQIVAVLAEHAVCGTRARYTPATASGLDDASATVGLLKELVERFVDERDWQPFHDPKNLSASIAIEAAELMEHFQWLRTDQLAGVRDDEGKMAQVREEIADILAYVVSFASTMDIDLASALADKMKKNAVKYPADEFKGRFG